MFAQEFPIEDTIVLWDSVFVRTPVTLKEGGFPFIDDMCMAMLQHVRNTLITGDNIVCLRRLMTYPPVGSILTLIAKAEHPEPLPSRGTSQPSVLAGRLGAGLKGISNSFTKGAHLGTHLFAKAQPVSVVEEAGARAESSVLGAARREREVQQARQEAWSYRSVQLQLGERMEGLVGRMHTEYVASATQGRAFTEGTMLDALAEMKHIKDVLLGNISPEESLYEPGTPLMTSHPYLHPHPPTDTHTDIYTDADREGGSEHLEEMQEIMHGPLAPPSAPPSAIATSSSPPSTVASSPILSFPSTTTIKTHVNIATSISSQSAEPPPKQSSSRAFHSSASGSDDTSRVRVVGSGSGRDGSSSVSRGGSDEEEEGREKVKMPVVADFLLGPHITHRNAHTHTRTHTNIDMHTRTHAHHAHAHGHPHTHTIDTHTPT
jgi:hypothetical protein